MASTYSSDLKLELMATGENVSINRRSIWRCDSCND